MEIKLGHIPGTKYLVTGIPRSGTTWMMMALEAGGMEVNAVTKRYEMNVRFENLSEKDLENKVTKVMIDQLLDIARPGMNGYKIVAMFRDPLKIIESHRRRGWKFVHPWLIEGRYEYFFWRTIERWERESANVTVCNLEIIQGLEQQFFEYLHSRGWPIRSNAAAETPNLDRRSNGKSEVRENCIVHQ